MSSASLASYSPSGLPEAAPLASGSDREATLLVGAAALDALEADWRALADAAPDRSVFLAYGFARPLADYHERRGERVLVARVDLGGSVACLLPVAIAKRSGLRVAAFLGDPISQYGDALLAAGAPRDLPEIALQALIESGEADVFALRRVRADAAIRGALARFARPIGSPTPSRFADMSGGIDADELMLALGGAKQRRERQRSRRRLSEYGDVVVEIRTGEDACAWIGEAIELKRLRLAQAGVASPVIDDPETAAVFRQAARDAGEGRAVVVSRLTIGGTPAAYELGLVRGRRYHAYLGVTVEGYPNASPGKIVMEETFRWCAREGIETFDLLPSDDGYKRHWSNGAVEVRDFIAATSLAGSLYADAWLGVVRPRLRAGLDLLPATLRRRVGAAAMRAGVR